MEASCRFTAPMSPLLRLSVSKSSNFSTSPLAPWWSVSGQISSKQSVCAKPAKGDCA